MKNKTFGKKAYAGLIRKLFLQTFLLLGIAGIVVLVLRTVLKGKLANGITRVLCFFLKVDWETGVQLYRAYVRANLEIILIVLALLMFFILFRILLSWFTKYFDQIIDGIENLSQEEENPVLLSPELKFVEEKLNETKTKLKTREEEARQAEERKNELVVYLAHDIKTPLTSVIGYLNLLEELPDMPLEQRAKYVHITLEKACRLEVLINEFFEITRYNNQSVPLYKQEVDLYYMLAQVSDELYPRLAAGGKSIQLQIPEDIIITADANKMARVFNNILKNAIAYGENGSEIFVCAQQDADTVVIQFENKGVIPPENLATIFEKFYRLDAARSSENGGAGLGLAIAKDIVQLHSGEISATSKDGYTWFTILLPQNLEKEEDKVVSD